MAESRPALPGRLLTIPDIEDQLQVSTSTIWRLMRAGELVPLRVRGQIRFRPTEVERYLASCEARPAKGLGTSVGHGRGKRKNGALPQVDKSAPSN